MAAFERVSTLRVRPQGRQSSIDFRWIRLPSDRPLPGPDDYNPKANREPKSPIKLWMAYFNLIRTGFGAGVLGMPLAISQSGIILGPLLAVFTGVLIIHTHLMLLWSLNEISRQLKIPYISYRYGFRIALLHGPPIIHCIGRHGPCLIATFMIMSQVGICVVFVEFTADSLRDIFDWQSSTTSLLALLVPYMALEFFMQTLKIVSYISMMGNFLNIAGLSLIFYHIFNDPHGELITVNTQPLPVLVAFGTFLFNMSAVGVVLSLDKALPDPTVMTKRCGVITIGMMIPTTIATVFGVLGYWSFGTLEENVIRSLPYDDDSAMASIGLYLIAVAFAYPIQCYPGIQIILELVKNYDEYEEPSPKIMKLVEQIARPSFVLLSFLISYLLPFQSPFVAFVGNLCTTMLALVFPALMELSILYPGPYGKYKVHLIKDLLIIVMGFVSWVFGVIFCAYLLYIRVLAKKSPNESR